MKLIDKPNDVAARHSGVSASRRKQLVGFLQNTDPATHRRTLKTWRDNKMPAAELALVEELLGISAPTETNNSKPIKPKDKK